MIFAYYYDVTLSVFLTFVNKMNSEYHFCFTFNKLTFNQSTTIHFDHFTAFKFELLIDHTLVNSTRPIMFTPNQNYQITLQNLCLMLRIRKDEIKTKSNCEIRLIAAQQGQQQKLIGCYEFELMNYIKAYHELNRNCIELSIQIGVDIIISYEVYLQITPEAIMRIINEHQAAKKSKIIQEENDQNDSFQSQQIENSQRMGQVRQIQYDLLSPVILKSRFWSPKRSRLGELPPQLVRKLKRSDTIMREQTVSQQLPMPYLKLRKSESSNTTMKQFPTKSDRMMTKVMQQLDVNNEQEQNDQNFIKLYEVIGSDSKITLPGKNDSYELYRSKTDRKIQIVKQDKKSKGKSSIEIMKTMPESKYNFKLYIVLIMILVLIIAGASMFLHQGKGKNPQRNKHKRKSKYMN